MAGGVFGRANVVPTKDEVQVPNLQWQTHFTADPSTNVLTCASPHLQVPGEVVYVSSNGTLPSPLQPNTFYRVLTAGLGWTQLGGPTDFFHGTAATDLITAPFPHGLTAGTPIFLYGPFDPFGDGQPSPLEGVSYYYVASSGLTATQFKVTYISNGASPTVDLFTDGSTQLWLFYLDTHTVNPITLMLASNVGWNPPPENPPIDITDAGVGIHSLWIRPLEKVGVVGITLPYMSGELVGGRGAIYLDNGKRHQYKNIQGTISGIVVNTDYWTSGAQQSPVTKWQTGTTLGGSAGSLVDLYSYSYPAISEWGLGDLGIIAGERYYSVCGDCAFGPAPPPPGGGGPGGEGGAGGKTPLSPEQQIKIVYREQDITNLVRRAQRASNMVENLQIVGQGVSGGKGTWQINPE
jgi:hypothetical protein